MTSLPAHRTAQAELRLTRDDGTPLPAGTVVQVEQTRHAFLFGGSLFGWERQAAEALNDAHARAFADLFSYGVLEFYWGKPPHYYQMDGYEPAEGDLRRDRRHAQAAWCRDHGIVAKGHPLMFFREPDWAAVLADADYADRLWGRITREVSEFRDSVQIWDVVNEPTNMPGDGFLGGAKALPKLYERMDAVSIIQKAHALAHAAAPEARLLLNDWDTSDRYSEIATRALDAGAVVHALGLQHHELNDYGGPERALELCDRFGRLGLPLHFTEIMIPSGDPSRRAAYDWTPQPGWVSTPEGEAEQAAQAVELYQTLFAHPAVAAIGWWDVSDATAFQRLPVGLLRDDGSPKPAYNALRDLIQNEWRTEIETAVGAGGWLTFQGVLGDYRLTTDDGRQADLRLDTSGAAHAVTLGPAPAGAV